MISKPPIETFERWLNNKGLMETTIKNYLYLFTRFNFHKFNMENVSRFLPTIKSNYVKSFLKNYQKFLLDNYKELNIDDQYHKEITEVIIITTRLKSIKLVKPLTEEQIIKVESFLPTEQLKLMLILSYNSGLRLGELLGIKINSFNWELWGTNKEQFGECEVYGKGGKYGLAIVPSNVMQRISKFIYGSESKATKPHHNLFSLGARSWQMKLRQAGIEAGLTQFDYNDKPIHETVVHPHRLRHSFASNLLKKGMDIRFIQEALRHSSITSTQRYTSIDKTMLKKEFEKLND